MQIISQADLALVNAYKKITLTAHLDGEKLDAGIDSCEYQASCGSTEEFSFGNACAAGATLSIDGAYPSLKGHKISVKWSVSDTEYPLLTGQVENCIVNAGRTTLEIWDDMYYGGSDAFVSPSRLLTDCNATEAFLAVAEAMGVEPDPETLEMLSEITISGGLSDLPEETSNSAVAGHIAGLLGGNAIMTRDGLLAVRVFSTTGWASEVYSGGASAENTDYSVTGVTIQREKKITAINTDGSTSPETQTLEYGAGDGTLMISNPLADQDAADRAYNALESVIIRPGSYRMPGGIQLEPGDMITAITMDGSYAVAVVQLAMTLDGGCQATVSCGGEAPSGGAVGQINEALRELQYALVRVKKLIAENAEIVSARIENLSADNIRVGVIRSSDETSFFFDLDNNIIEADGLALKISGKTFDEYAEETQKNIANVQIQADGISTSVSADIDGLEQRVSTVEQDAQSWGVRIETIENDGVGKLAANGVTADDDGFHVWKDGEETQTDINHEGLEVVRTADAVSVLTADADGVNALNLTARKYLSAGYSRIEGVTMDGEPRTAIFFTGV